MALAYASDLATGHSRTSQVSTRIRAVASFIRRCCATLDAMPTRMLAEARGDEITLRRELHHIDIGNRAEQNLL